MAPTSCPLCGGGGSHLYKPSGVTTFDGLEYRFRRCGDCRSLFYAPMPDATTLGRIYGPSYAERVSGTGEVPDPKSPELVIDVLRARPSGVFVDYGCGQAELLGAASAEGWTPIGVEFDPAVVRSLRAGTGSRS